MAGPSELQASIDAFRARIIAREAHATNLLSATYADALVELQPRIAALDRQIAEARAEGRTPGVSWLFQQARYRELDRLIRQQMDRYGEVAQAVTTLAQQATTRDALATAGTQLTALTGDPGMARLAAGWAAVPDDAIARMVGALQAGTPLAETIASYGADASKTVNEALVRGLALGDSAQATGRIVMQALGITRTRAEVLVRTETLRASRAASIAAYTESGVVAGWRWSASLSARTCPACLSLNGQVFPLTTPMASHASCFPAGTLCSGPEVVGSSARWYEGDLVDICFASGDHLSVTPNHPILTPHGWVAAGLLNEGSSVVRSSLSERELATVYPHYQNGPALIEHVAKSLGSESTVTSIRVPTAAEDFHGDGIGSNVSVIRANRLLGHSFDSAIREPSLHDEFGGRRVGLAILSGFGSLASLLDGSLSSARSLMGLCGECLALLRCGLLHSQIHTLGSPTRSYAGDEQSFSDSVPTNPVALCQRLLGFTSQIAPGDFSGRQRVPISSGNAAFFGLEGFALLGRSKQPPRLERAHEPSRIDMESHGGAFGSLSGHVCPDRVLYVRRRSFRGHVYNLETTDGWYIANNIIVHNCRCAAVPWSPKWDEDWQAGEDWLRAQPAAVQEQVFSFHGGEDAAAAFRASEVSLADFTVLRAAKRSLPLAGQSGYGRRNAKTWGESWEATSLANARKRAAAR